ncbi:hypothetical protein CANCADRAFT_22858 [Tortispora caseinolytica NRRL Y-17796]|uniref:mRNA export factor GLE1 n=1 Tax=Tortispora caseinolytica NRRL Y-17796 TaxID=767744 RepID=A0A1E4TIW3_9ASCO|nr:hypothetical protein CANCADRAFT_22858 [Tortispora caseinolytica NRRL Y-17796]
MLSSAASAIEQAIGKRETHLREEVRAKELRKEELRKLQENSERERIEKERIEKERIEKERIEKERLEKERLEKERIEKERVERERIEKERHEREQLEEELIKKEQLDKERLENEQIEKERIEKENKDRLNKQLEKEEKDRLEKQLNTNPAESDRNYYLRIISFIKSNIYKELDNDKQAKNWCMLRKRKIKPRIGQLTNSVSQIKIVIESLNEEFLEAKSQSDLKLKWCLNFFAKSLVQQAESEVASDAARALALGSVAMFFMKEYPVLVDILIARFVKKCPYVIGFNCEIDTFEKKKAMGYKFNKITNEFEDHSRHTDRMQGIVAVWGVITQMGSNNQADLNSPYSIVHSWIFLSRTLNLPLDQISHTHVACVASWWDLASKRFIGAYGAQGEKLLTLAGSIWTKALESKKFPSVTRLALLEMDWKNEGKLGIGAEIRAR